MRIRKAHGNRCLMVIAESSCDVEVLAADGKRCGIFCPVGHLAGRILPKFGTGLQGFAPEPGPKPSTGADQGRQWIRQPRIRGPRCGHCGLGTAHTPERKNQQRTMRTPTPHSGCYHTPLTYFEGAESVPVFLRGGGGGADSLFRGQFQGEHPKARPKPGCNPG